MNTKNKIIFLDRDGTLNYRRLDYVKTLSEFELLPHVGRNLSKLSSSGFKLIVVTNQSAINRKLLDVNELNRIHEYMIKELCRDNCIIDSVYYCPHKPDENCLCRKPKTKLLEQCISDFSPVDLSNSWMIGDSESDIKAGLELKINTFRIKTNESLENAVKNILHNRPNN